MSAKRQHSAAFRARVVKAKLAGASPSTLASKHGIHTSMIYRWVKDAAPGKPTAKPRGKKPKPKPAKRKTDVDVIVDGLLESLRGSLSDAIREMVNLGIQRQLDEVRDDILTALRSA